MGALVWGLGLWLLGFLAHLAAWRVRTPRRQTRALLAIFFGVLAAGVTVWAARGPQASWPAPTPTTAAECLAAALLTASLALAYVISYSALEADSPTLVMVRMIAQAGRAGLPRAQFHRQLTDELLVLPRLADLVRDGLVELRDGRYRLLPKGRRLVTVFLLFRRVLGAGKGG